MSSELRLTLLYALIGVLWIVLSDFLIAVLFAGSPSALLTAQTYKGWFYVIATALILYGLLRREFRARQRLEGELEDADTVLQNVVIAASPLPIFVMDAEARVKIWNLATEQLFGWTEAEVKGRFLPTVPPARLEEFHQLRRQVLEGQAVRNVEVHRQRKDGELLDIIVSMSPLRLGRQLNIIGVAVDMTARHRDEADRHEREMLRMALSKEIELRNVRNRFTSMISHELRGPLTTISTSAGMIERYHDRMSKDARDEHLRQIQAQIRLLNGMLDDILHVLKTEHIGPNFNPQPLDLIALTSRLVDEARLNAREKHTIEFQTELPVLEIQGDEKLIRHAISNLIANAMKYSPDGGTVWVSASTDGDHAVVTIRDAGIGIAEADLQRLFEPFQRGQNVGSIPGTGLGLTITKQAVDLHGGALDVTSVLGQGTTFTITLPVNLA